MPREYRTAAGGGASRSGAAEARQFGGLHSAPGQTKEQTHAASENLEASLQEQPALARQHRQFELPPDARVQPVKQTLVQMDVPPDIVLKQEIPVPTALLWHAMPIKKQFFAPPLQPLPKVPQRLPVIPTLDVPNAEVNVAQLNIASTILTDTPHMPQPPSIAPPVSSAGQEPAKEIPHIGVAPSNQPSAGSLISLPPYPLRSSSVLVLPPANQVAPTDIASNGSSSGRGAGAGANDQGSGLQGRGSSTSDGNGSGGPDAGGSGNKTGPLTGGGTGEAGSGLAGTSGSGGGTAASGNGGVGAPSSGNGSGTSNSGSSGSGSGNSAGAGSGSNGSTGIPRDMAGFTRLTLPKDGKFGVVVLGSAGEELYPESVGALSGKVVYTVYIKIGLRKNWILQYCLAKASEKAVRGRATPVDPPWPFLMMRPEEWSASDPDYIMIHGTLTSGGQFDELSMIYPNELERRDLLLSSLKLWAFRPAARDGEPVAVEVLLIIPRESE